MSGLKAQIYVGDCVEEFAEAARALATQLKLTGRRCFLLHETVSGHAGYNVTQAADVCGMIALVTGGTLLPFDATSLDKVKELLEATAVYAVGGVELLEQQAKQLHAAKRL